MSFKRFSILAVLAIFAATSAPAMDAQPCKLRGAHRPIGNLATRTVKRIPRTKKPHSKVTARPRSGSYPYVGRRRTPKGVFL